VSTGLSVPEARAPKFQARDLAQRSNVLPLSSRFASEAAEVTRLRILQETGAALLAQQRTSSFLVLDLLGADRG
jgi:hypothetical protein